MNKALDTVEAIKDWWFRLHFTPLQKRALLIVAVVIALTSTLFLFNGRTQEVAAFEPPPKITDIAPTVVVGVAGGVRKPGVYTLPSNSRVVDAITAAGGLAPGADASDVNQARVIKDGEQIFIYPKSALRTMGGAVVKKSAGPISINRASAKEFESLPGIGPVIANRIVSYRKEHGSFTALEDLLNVPGIGESTFAKFKNKLRM